MERRNGGLLTPTPNSDPRLGLCLQGIPLSLLTTLSPHRIPLLFPLLFLTPPSSPLSSLVFWANPQSISPPRQPQKNNVYCIYNIYGSYGSQSHLAHSVLSTYLPTYRPTNPSEFNLFIVQFIGRAASSRCLGKDGWWEFASLPLWHRGGKIVHGQMELSSRCLLPSLSAEWLFVFLQ